MIDYKLQNIPVVNEKRTHDYSKLYVRTSNPLLFTDDGDLMMPKNSKYEFNTYFGGLSTKKWNRYTSVSNFKLHLDITGTFEIRLMSFINDMEYNIAVPESIYTKHFNKADGEIVLEIPQDDALRSDMIAFEITTYGTSYFHKGWYSTEIDENQLREVDLNISTTTFKKEEFIRANIKLYEQLLESDEPIAEHLTVTIVDNGKTLGDDPLSKYPQIKKYDNVNYGGAGGFSRGMLEALHADKKPTHMLVMDDDVSVSTESFIRTYNLMTLVNDEYKDAFLSGAMLSMQLQNHQVEDVGNIFDDGTFGAVKPFERDLNLLDHVVSNETYRYNHQRQYAAFWYCCFPLSVPATQGLTMPFFVRGDDAEFGLRNDKRKFMTLNGICVWHMSFGHSKFNAFNESYLAIRNGLIIQSIIPECANIAPYENLFLHDIETELRKFNYSYAEMMCDAVEDFLRGPEWLATVNPETLLKEKSAKKPKITEFTEKMPASVSRLYDPMGVLDIKQKTKMKLTHNGHEHCKDEDMTDVPGIMLNEFRAYHPARIYMHRELWFVNDDGYTGYKTHIDRERYAKIVERKKTIEKRMETEGPTVRKRWANAHSYLTSEKFWIKYLGLDPKDYQ